MIIRDHHLTSSDWIGEVFCKMADDDWENEDFVPVLNVPALTSTEEEDLLTKEQQNLVNNINIEEVKAKKAAEAEAAFAAKLESSEQLQETAVEKKVREKKQVEEADHALTNELFTETAVEVPKQTVGNTRGPFKPSGLGAIPLSTNQDHFEFGNLVSVRLSDSTVFNISAFYRGLSKVLKNNNITTEALDEIMSEIQKIKDTKVKTSNSNKKGEPGKKTQAQKKKEDARHAEVFGFKDNVDKYDHYSTIEDDFM
jgi:hypothetical protein